MTTALTHQPPFYVALIRTYTSVPPPVRVLVVAGHGSDCTTLVTSIGASCEVCRLGFWIFEKQEAQEYRRVPKKQTSTRAAQRHQPEHHAATGIHGHRASPAGSGAVSSPRDTAAVGTRPEQPPGTAHPHMGPAPGPTGSPAPQPQTPPGTSTHGRQPAASRVAATQAHPEPRPRHGTPDRPTEGPAYAPPKGPPTQTLTATPTDTTNTRPSSTVHLHAHHPTESPNPEAPATPSATAPGDHLQAPAPAEPASQRHHAPPTGPAIRAREPSSPGRPAPDPGPGPDRAYTTVPADTPRSAGPGSLPGPPPGSEGHAREE